MNGGGGSCLSTSTDSVCGRPADAAPGRSTFLLLLAASLLLFAGLGRRSLWAAEGRWAEVTREMLLTGDFFHPTIGGEPYFDKPLLTYWFRAALSAVTGTLNELIVRIPSAVAGLAAVWATMRIGARLWSAQTGRIAGWLLLTMYAFLFWARTGTADAENLAAITLAVAWYWSKRDRPNFSAFLVFYLIAFIGALTKGLTAVVVPMLIVLPDMLRERRWRVLFTFQHLSAFGLASLVYLSPFLYASLTRPGDYPSSGLALVFQENILRYFQPLDHKGPMYLYLYQLPVLLLPWTPLFVLALIAVARFRKDLDGPTRWLIQAIVLVFLFFSLSGSRRSYYILPILPLCALLMAVFVVWLREPRMDGLRQRGMHLQRGLILGLGAFDLAIPLILILAGGVLHFHASHLFDVASLGIGTTAILLALGLNKVGRWPDSARNEHRLILPWIGAAAVLLGGYFACQQNILEVNRTERPFARQLAAMIAGSPSMRVATFPRHNANLLFYLDSTKLVEAPGDPNQVRAFMEQPGPAMLIVQHRHMRALPAEMAARLEQQPHLHEVIHPWESQSTKGEKWIAWFLKVPADPNGATAVEKGAADAR